MNPKIQKQFEKIKNRFAIEDEQKVLWYLEKVWYHRLSFYFKNNTDFEKIISDYIFDKILRHLVLDMLEIIENTLKCVIVNEIWVLFENKARYLDRDIYNPDFVDERLQFIYHKMIERKKSDLIVKNFLEKQSKNEELSDNIFFDKLTFGELIKVFRDMKTGYKTKVSKYFGISLKIFDNRIFALKYLRNLCSHHENIFNKKMTIHLMWYEITKLCWNTNSFLSYFAILCVFNKLLIPNYKRKEKVIDKMDKYNISFANFTQKENLPSELESEAWEVLVNLLYTKYIKNQGFL